MKKRNIELIVGGFVLASFVGLMARSLRVSGLAMFSRGGYEVEAFFSNAGGLKEGAGVHVAGVQVGQVRQIALDEDRARVVLAIVAGTEIQEDAIASIKTRGLMGEKYVAIAPGASEVILKGGERIRETQPAVDLESLISKYVFSDQKGGE